MESSLKVLFVGCGDIAVRSIEQLGASNTWQALAMRRQPQLLPTGIDGVAGDVRDSVHLSTVLDQHSIDAMVVTLSPDQMSDEGYYSTYVEGAKSIVKAIGLSGRRPALVLWVSSTGVYGQCQGEWVDESSAVEPSSFRGKRLLEAESIVHGLNVPSVVVRFSGIYGPGRERLIRQVKSGEIVSETPCHWTNRIHSEDCAGTIVHLLGQFCSGAELQNLYVATDNLPAPAYEVQHWLANELGLPQEAGSAGNMTEAGSNKSKAGNRRCRNQRLRQNGFEFRYPTFREGYRALLSVE